MLAGLSEEEILALKACTPGGYLYFEPSSMPYNILNFLALHNPGSRLDLKNLPCSMLKYSTTKGVQTVTAMI